MLRKLAPFRHAKIVCTLGPATFSRSAIEELMLKGMDIARLNFSHGDYRIYQRVIDAVRKSSRKLGKPVTIIQDLQGPKIRTGELIGKQVFLEEGQRIRITTRKMLGNGKMFSIPYASFPQWLRKGNLILIDDGLIELRVLKIEKGIVACRVVAGGMLHEHKGVNLPYVKIRGEPLTLKDKRDLAFGIRHGVDFVAMSFVCDPNDIRELKKRIPKSSSIGVIAKIEKPEAIDKFDEILAISDAIMIARGDLAVESSTEVVPCLQKEIIQKCHRAMKPVITATQMLDSMVSHPRPTRAEASDVANAVLDGSDALMLSAETASGHYPFQSVAMMDKIIREVEHHHRFLKEGSVMAPHLGIKPLPLPKERDPISGVIERAACQIADGIDARLICCLTETGRSAVYLSHARPRQPIVALTHQQRTLKRLSLVWGVHCFYIQDMVRNAKIFNRVRKRLLELRVVKSGDRIVVTTGVFTHSPNTTRITKVHQI